MNKIFLIFAMVLFPTIVSAQSVVEIDGKFYEEKYNARDQKFIDLEAEHRAEINRGINNTLRNMSDKEIAIMTGFINANENKKANITGDFDNKKNVEGKDATAVRKYIENSFNTESYVPMSEPELVEIEP